MAGKLYKNVSRIFGQKPAKLAIIHVAHTAKLWVKGSKGTASPRSGRHNAQKTARRLWSFIESHRVENHRKENDINSYRRCSAPSLGRSPKLFLFHIFMNFRGPKAPGRQIVQSCLTGAADLLRLDQKS